MALPEMELCEGCILIAFRLFVLVQTANPHPFFFWHIQIDFSLDSKKHMKCDLCKSDLSHKRSKCYLNQISTDVLQSGFSGRSNQTSTSLLHQNYTATSTAVTQQLDRHCLEVS